MKIVVVFGDKELTKQQVGEAARAKSRTLDDGRGRRPSAYIEYVCETNRDDGGRRGCLRSIYFADPCPDLQSAI